MSMRHREFRIAPMVTLPAICRRTRPRASSIRRPREPGPQPSPRHEVVHLVPGARIADGRYRLLVFHGGAPPLQFWQALDTALNRQVALTFVDPDGALAEEQLHAILSRTMRLSRINRPGIARVLDVVHTGAGGLVVAEWVRGGSLQEVADTAPSPVGAARAMQSLAAAAEAAHQVGVALSIDHPSRVRVSITGDVVLAFPATMPDATPEDDIRGIGAALYALLVNRWPLPEAGCAAAGPRRPQFAWPARRTQPHRPRDTVPDFRGGCARGPGGRRNTQCLNTFESPATSDRGRRPHRPAEPHQGIAPPPDAPSRFGVSTTVDDEVAARHRRILIGGSAPPSR
ncbi:putative peptidoglycan flippase MurJ [Mycobacterium xenopi 3993]|nr:putative peptidoglycan flippase MurJ [Mycobacterium xenopi 3993]